MDWVTDFLRPLERFSQIPVCSIGETTVTVGTVSRAFNEQGIEIPFPQRDLHIKSGTLNVSRAPSA